MSYSFSLIDNEIVEVLLEGEQTGENTFQMMKDSLPYNDALSLAGKPIKLLINLEKVTKITPESAKTVIQGIRSIAADKIAVYGAPPEVATNTTSIQIEENVDRSKQRTFQTRQEALAWLKESLT